MLQTPRLPGASAESAHPGRLANWSTLAAVLVALTAFRFWAAAHLGLIPDETYYWLWSRVPSWGYYDHPPMIAWWIWLSTRFFGPTSLGVRFLPVLSVLLVSVAVYGTARELLADKAYAARAALWVNAMFLIGGGAVFATPDAPSILFWTLGVWILARIRNRPNAYLWILFGAIAGLGCVSKYTNLFLGAAVVTWLLADPKARRWLASPWLYIGGAVALAVFAPVILWNAGHHWVSFAKQFGRIEDGHLTLRYLGEFLAVQFALLNPLIAILAIAAIGRALRSPRGGQFSPAAFLLATAGPLIVYMLVHSLHDRVHGNWPGPIYPTIALLAAMADGKHLGIHLRRMASLAAPVGIGLPLLALAYFGLTGADPLPFPSQADLLFGWSGLFDEVNAIRERENAGWIATADYGLTAELDYHSRGISPVEEIVDRERYSYDRPNLSLSKKPALLILRDHDKKDGWVLTCFGVATPVGVVARSAGNHFIESYHLYKVSGALGDLLSHGCLKDRNLQSATTPHASLRHIGTRLLHVGS